MNVWLPPLAVALVGIGMFVWRSRRRGARS
jgi:hypothetical protein